MDQNMGTTDGKVKTGNWIEFELTGRVCEATVPPQRLILPPENIPAVMEMICRGVFDRLGDEYGWTAKQMEARNRFVWRRVATNIPGSSCN